jgi:retron-type reverse transcriptase
VPGGGLISGIFDHVFERIISLENLFAAWREFKRGKTKKQDVQEFEFRLEDNLFLLHEQLKNKTYETGRYEAFYVRDPKLRHIHKATVFDRVLHQAIFRVLYHQFDQHFIFDSYSCRFRKGTHAGVERLHAFGRRVSANNNQLAYVLKCDIRKFFDTIDHEILLRLLSHVIHGEDTKWLIKKIIGSFEKIQGKAIPLGNVTSQLFANVYLNELDQFVKHILKQKYYIRYCDDFVILSQSHTELEALLPRVNVFLQEKLKLSLHPKKVSISKLRQGIDFLGYVQFPNHRILRTKTKKRMFRNIVGKEYNPDVIQSYVGLLKHCNGHGIQKTIG